jgi:hypothetical protein
MPVLSAVARMTCCPGTAVQVKVAEAVMLGWSELMGWLERTAASSSAVT